MIKRSKKLLDQVCEAIRLKHYSIRTEKVYVNWIRHCILVHEKHHPIDAMRAKKPKRLPT